MSIVNKDLSLVSSKFLREYQALIDHGLASRSSAVASSFWDQVQVIPEYDKMPRQCMFEVMPYHDTFYVERWPQEFKITTKLIRKSFKGLFVLIGTDHLRITMANGDALYEIEPYGLIRGYCATLVSSVIKPIPQMVFEPYVPPVIAQWLNAEDVCVPPYVETGTYYETSDMLTIKHKIVAYKFDMPEKIFHRLSRIDNYIIEFLQAYERQTGKTLSYNYTTEQDPLRYCITVKTFGIDIPNNDLRPYINGKATYVVEPTMRPIVMDHDNF